ncbi:hypothetical protein BV898_10933 [Hypsibius exemplaris]|uniref:Uncharacterized protein n=1 Tax=Hypsibius exemplaris TaxID=2072580 RepID=A0A1W0WI62_HYPEX|nr:hypothetical protein BV898_10933 [Hypsibius exemplaris]
MIQATDRDLSLVISLYLLPIQRCCDDARHGRTLSVELTVARKAIPGHRLQAPNPGTPLTRRTILRWLLLLSDQRYEPNLRNRPRPLPWRHARESLETVIKPPEKRRGRKEEERKKRKKKKKKKWASWLGIERHGRSR